jgi:hypothetical protein
LDSGEPKYEYGLAYHIKPKHDKWSFKYSYFRFLRALNTPDYLDKSKILDIENGFEEYENYIHKNVEH